MNRAIMRDFSHAYVSIILLMLLLSPLGAVHGDDGVSAKENKKILHFVLRDITVERANWLVEEAKRAGFNTIMVQIADGVMLENSVWKPLPDAWSKEWFTRWIKRVKEQGLEIIPEVKFLTHQEKLFQNRYPWLMFNKTTYDPRGVETYQYVTSLIDEILNIVQPKAFHIGHDEVAGHSEVHRQKWLETCDEVLPSELFLLDVLKLHDYLRARGVETWMWGDMLISPKEFPGMLDKHQHGTVSGYGKTLRDQLPREIVITDWHYFDTQSEFPSLYVMQQEGFRVIGSTWKREKTTTNFSRYSSKNGGYGMMATTWFHVQRREWDLVREIIKTSGEIFSKDFPDEK